MPDVKMVTSPTCGYCHAAKNLLDQRGIAYEEIDLFTSGDQAQNLLKQSGRRTVPQIFINEHPIGGFTELTQLFSNPTFDLNQVGSV